MVRGVEAYFNGIQTLEADFRQLAPDGGVTTGKLYIDRNRGAMRFDYDPPSKILLVAPGDWRLIFYDGSIQQVNVIPIGETPLGFIFKDEVKLEGDVTVRGGEERPGEIDVTLAAPRTPDQGQGDAHAARTRCGSRLGGDRRAGPDHRSIILDQSATGMPLDRKLFVWRDPKLFGFPKD